MAAGQCKEFDTPHRLLSAPWSMFNSLVEDTGPHASAALRRMAAEGPQDDGNDKDDSDDDAAGPSAYDILAKPNHAAEEAAVEAAELPVAVEAREGMDVARAGDEPGGL